jgi:hypothetical protein
LVAFILSLVSNLAAEVSFSSRKQRYVQKNCNSNVGYWTAFDIL